MGVPQHYRRQRRRERHAPIKNLSYMTKHLFYIPFLFTATTTAQTDEDWIEPAEVLEEIVVHTHTTTENVMRASATDVIANFDGSLASSLEYLPGVEAQRIGSMSAKFVIRGLGLNRLLVVENGLRREGQQWGADHGLELDAMAVERIEIIKGAGAIAYGSDAMAGVVRINNETLPTMGVSGRAVLTFLGNNRSLGQAWQGALRTDKHFWKVKLGYIDYGDFRVPTDEVYYLQTRIPIYDGVMTNTAGDERSFMTQWGTTGERYTGTLSVSGYWSKTGFFSGAHGVPSVRKTLPDGDTRSVDFPFQTARHIMASYHAQWKEVATVWNFTTGFQHNLRREYSAFHSHFPNQPVPVRDADKELEFLQSAWEQALSMQRNLSEQHLLEVGVQNQWVLNQVGGYSFLLPNYQRHSLGLYAKWAWEVSNRHLLELGTRYDRARLKVEGHYDTILYDYLTHKGYSDARASDYAWRSRELDRSFSQGNVSLGITFHPSHHWHSALTLGSSFRFPTAIELGANGIHHGAFRHELGNPDLDVERGYSLDWNHRYEAYGWTVDASMYGYYFSNYIFLKPSGRFSALPHGGQIYQYDQSKALMVGAELQVGYQWSKWQLSNVSEYVYNSQLGTARYALPFTTPANTVFSVGYRFPEFGGIAHHLLEISYKLAAAQHRIAQNEHPTRGYSVCNLKYQTQLPWKEREASVQLRVQNLWNTKYYQHNSFYRAIEIPALGRSIDVVIKLTF